jgi:hypothetical protein
MCVQMPVQAARAARMNQVEDQAHGFFGVCMN